MSLEVFGSGKDIIAEITAQVLAASDVLRSSSISTESTWNFVRSVNADLVAPHRSKVSVVNLDSLS